MAATGHYNFIAKHGVHQLNVQKRVSKLIVFWKNIGLGMSCFSPIRCVWFFRNVRCKASTMRPWHRKWHFGLRSSMRRSPSTMSWAGSFWVVKITWICTVRELCVSVGKNGGRGWAFLPWDDLILRVFPDLRCNPIHLWEMLKMDGTEYIQIKYQDVLL